MDKRDQFGLDEGGQFELDERGQDGLDFPISMKLRLSYKNIFVMMNCGRNMEWQGECLLKKILTNVLFGEKLKNCIVLIIRIFKL